MTLSQRRLVVHALVVLVLLVIFLLQVFALHTADAGPTAGMALALSGIPLLALGLPWPLHYLLDPYAYDGAIAISMLGMAGPAVVNVVIHAAPLWRKAPDARAPGWPRPSKADRGPVVAREGSASVPDACPMRRSTLASSGT